jgi:hypothetical protein
MTDATTTTTATSADKQVPVSTRTFPVYVIHCKWSLTTLDKFLATFGQCGFLRIVYETVRDEKTERGNKNHQESKGPQETDRNIAILSKEAYDGLIAAGYGDRKFSREFKIAPYELNRGNYPGPGQLNTLFVPVPHSWADDDAQVQEVINEKLEHLAEWDIVPRDSWKIVVPLKSRGSGGVKSGCFIKFDRSVPLDTIAMARVLLTDTHWPEQETTAAPRSSKSKPSTSLFQEDAAQAVFRCYWTREHHTGYNGEHHGSSPDTAVPAISQPTLRDGTAQAGAKTAPTQKKPFYASEKKAEETSSQKKPFYASEKKKEEEVPKRQRQPAVPVTTTKPVEAPTKKTTEAPTKKPVEAPTKKTTEAPIKKTTEKKESKSDWLEFQEWKAKQKAAKEAEEKKTETPTEEKKTETPTEEKKSETPVPLPTPTLAPLTTTAQ